MNNHNGKAPTYDYDLQVWVIGGIIQDCGHPRKEGPGYCCQSRSYAGQEIAKVKGALSLLRELREIRAN